MKIPIGVDTFDDMIRDGYAYVDKTLFIEEVIEQSAKVQLITRPRRFGKTLNMSMLANFFDHRKDSRSLFKGLAIEARPCFERCNSLPVLFLSFKDLKVNDFDLFLGRYRDMVERLYKEHRDLLDHLDETDRPTFLKLMTGKTLDQSLLIGAIARLMRLLYQVHGKPVLLLLDEYDSPIENAYAAGYYKEAIPFFQVALGEALKGNEALEKAVLTGILRIARESIFSDLNNLRVFSVLHNPYSSAFGFTEAEVLDLLQQTQLSDQIAAIRDWYNGYQIGQTLVYNPWSFLSFLYDDEHACLPYWVNTSSNTLIHRVMLAARASTQETIAQLMAGETIESTIEAHTTFDALNSEALWSLLVFSGYLTLAGKERVDTEMVYRLRIPNREVWHLYKTIFSGWLKDQMGRDDVAVLLAGLVQGDVTIIEKQLQTLVISVMSFYETASDKAERVYHAFALGLIANLNDRYHIRSNRESGHGRYDLMMIPRDVQQPGVLIEFKLAKSVNHLDTALAEALDQLAKRDYAAELRAQGVQMIHEIAVAFSGKQVRVGKQGRA